MSPWTFILLVSAIQSAAVIGSVRIWKNMRGWERIDRDNIMEILDVALYCTLFLQVISNFTYDAIGPA
jgi:hypothetical protein